MHFLFSEWILYCRSRRTNQRWRFPNLKRQRWYQNFMNVNFYTAKSQYLWTVNWFLLYIAHDEIHKVARNADIVKTVTLPMPSQV